MRLRDLFDKIAVKRLSTVEVRPSVSHQHELNGVKALLEMFGETGEKKTFPATFLYVRDDEEAEEKKFITSEGRVTWYDARAKHPTRTEYRLYYATSSFPEDASEGDLLIAGFNGREVWFIVAEQGSDIEAQLLWLFDMRDKITADKSGQFQIRDLDHDRHTLNIIEQQILEYLGFETDLDAGVDTESLLTRFHGRFPTTAEFSSYAREVSGIENSCDNPDETLLKCWEEEERLFRALEKTIVQKQLNTGFSDVDHFIEFAKSVLNRRNSRAGHAFENHIAQILNDHEIMYDRGKRTEYKSKPDFILPSIDLYHRAMKDESLVEYLTMLAAKTSCKDRWRQITKEAKLIETKHLITLEPAISQDQTEEMKRHHVQLVVPDQIKTSYLPEQQAWLMNMSDFIHLVSERQKNYTFLQG